MDLNVIYSKTAKGLRVRASIIGGLSSQLMKVLSHIDGTSKAETILDKYDEITEQKLLAALTQLETEGYIKAVAAAVSDEEWALTTNFAPMEVEEFEGTITGAISQDSAAQAEASAEKQAKLQAEYKAKLKEEARLQAEAKAREKEEQALAKAEKKAQLEAEAEAKAQAEREAKAEKEASKKAELKAADAAEEKRAKVQAEAKEKAKREIERMKSEANEAKKQVEAQAQIDAQLKAEAQSKADAKRKAEEDVRKKAELEAEAAADKARAKAEAEELARIESERAAHAAEEAQKQAKMEASAKAEEAAKLEQEREAEAVAKREAAAAEQARLVVAQQIKAEQAALEAKQAEERQAKALEDARIEAESKLKALAEQNSARVEAAAKASADASLKASLAMQSFAIDAQAAQESLEITPQAEVKPDPSPATVQKTMSAAARLKAEIKAKVEAEQLVLANYQAHQKALADEKVLAAQEMERISREAEAERKKQQASPSNSASDNAVDVQWINHPDEDDSEFEEERIVEEVEKVGREIKRKTKRIAEVEGREEIARSAKAEALLKAKIKQHDKRLAMINKLLKWAAMARKSLLIYLPPAILLILGLLHIVNISPLVDPIEKLATESFGAPVKIDEVRASLWPRPHLVLKNVLIGADSAQKIDALNIVPDSLTLSDEVKTVRSLEMSGLKIEPANFSEPLQWISHLSKAQHLKVEQIQLNNIVVKIKDLELAPMQGEVVLSDLRELKSIDLTSEDDALAMRITPQDSNFDVSFTGANWALPMNPKVVFSALKGTGSVNQSQSTLNVTEGTMFGGSLTGKVALDWSNQWAISGNFNLDKAILPDLLKTFNSGATVDGKLKLSGVFSNKSDLATKLTDTLEVSANFAVLNGKINDVELIRAVASKNNQSLAGDSTNFDKLTGHVKIKNGRYQYTQLVLKSDQFQAEGNVDIEPNQDISGKISADLTAQSRRLQTRFDLAGKVNNVKRQ